jgi:hypothetical protein
MAWFRRVLLMVPFAIAAVLNVLMLNADRLHLHREHIAGYGFLFGAPWAWLLDRGWVHVPDYHHHTMQLLFGYAIILWTPALLYSGCLWLLFLGFARLRYVGRPPARELNS